MRCSADDCTRGNYQWIRLQQRTVKATRSFIQEMAKGKRLQPLVRPSVRLGGDTKCLCYKFIKSPQRTYGEQIALRKIGVELRQLGVGFDLDENA